MSAWLVKGTNLGTIFDMKNLRSNNGRYYYRRKYPDDAMVQIGKRELKSSLGEISQTEAEMAAQLLNQRFDKHVADARGLHQDRSIVRRQATKMLQDYGLLNQHGDLQPPRFDPRKPEHDTIEKQIAILEAWEAKYEAIYDSNAPYPHQSW